MTTATDERTDIEILSELDFEESEPKCDYLECDQVAKAKIVCGVCFEGCELMCGPHTVTTAIMKETHPEELLVFTETCGHRPEFGNCEIVAL